MERISITPDSKIRLDELLRRELPLRLGTDISNSKLRRLIMAGCVYVNGRQIRVPAFTVFAGSAVCAEVEQEKLFFEKQPDDIKYEVTDKDVLFEDDYIIVLNKPSHFPTESTIIESRDNLHKALIRFLFERQKIQHPNMKNPPYVGIMHRLDRDTSGVILFTKKREVNAACHEMFENHTAHKEYTAVISSADKASECLRKAGSNTITVEFFMGRISPKGQAAKWGKLPESKGGQYSRTEFTFDGNIVHCNLFTGRTHQIRVHLSSLGIPILGDTLYGGKPYDRIMLHASKLTFPHPVTKEQITVTAECSDVSGQFFLPSD